MSELNASKAREIVEKWKRSGKPNKFEAGFVEEATAKGFLQAHTLAERVLVKALKEIKEHETKKGQAKKDQEVFRISSSALSEWRKANGE